MAYVVMGWAIAVGGALMAVVCALNLLGLARGWLRTARLGRIENLGLGMVAAGLSGFMWSIPVNDAPVEISRPYWLLVGAVGLVLFASPGAWGWFRRGARTEGGDALFFLRVYTVPNDWRLKHLALLAAITASVVVVQMVPDDSWWAWAGVIWFLAMLRSLSLLPVHRGRRQPNANG